MYWGAPTIREWLPGDDCIIEALRNDLLPCLSFTLRSLSLTLADFSSPKDLAEYLKKVANDDRLYAKYFEWKKKPLREGFMLLYNNCAVNADCRYASTIALCLQLHRRLHLFVNVLVPGKYSYSSDCVRKSRTIRRIGLRPFVL